MNYRKKNVSNRFYTFSYGSEIIRLLESKKKTEEGFDATVNILEQYKACFRFPWNHVSKHWFKQIVYNLCQ